MIRRMRWVGIVALLAVSAVGAQEFPNLLQQPGADGPDASDGVIASLIADVKTIHPKQPFTIGVKLEVQPGFHTFYCSAGGIALPTKIDFSGPQGFAIGPVQFPGPDVELTRLPGADGKETVDVAYVYERTTVVLASVTPLASAPSGHAEFSAQVSFQYCKNQGGCFPPKPQKLTLKLPIGSRTAAPAPSDDVSAFREAQARLPVAGAANAMVRVFASVAGTTLKPGDKGELTVTLQTDNGWVLPNHRPNVKDIESTEVIAHEIPGIRFEPPRFPPGEDKPPFLSAFSGLRVFGNGKPTTVKIPFEVTNEFRGDEVVFSGIVRCQPIAFPDEKLPVRFLSFAALAARGTTALPTPTTGAAAQVTPFAAASKSDAVAEMDVPKSRNESVADYLVYAFLGGLILNIMPCVLPVIPIKLLSFVQQAGESRQRVFMLNLFYALGIISVFLALALLSATASLKWGESFQRPEFNFIMAGVVFSMGLSLLGVFEIPIPGMVGSADGHKEGLPGAFMTGILATLLATPCSAPLLGTALTWSLQQPLSVRFPVWAVMGLGMASPYLVLGLFPAAVRWLPKPGPWMVAFKEFTGLILMATVIYLVTLVDQTYTIPVLVMLVGLAIAFWMIGTLYDLDSSPARRWTVRFAALAIALLIGWLAFGPIREASFESSEKNFRARVARSGGAPISVLQKSGNGRIEFEPYTDARLQQLLQQGKTVMIDFTADWCTTCRFVEKTAIHTFDTEKLFEEFDMVALEADRTQPVPELEKALTRFGGDAIPYLVLISAGNPTKPVILKEFYTKADLLEKMREVGPSRKS